MNIHKSSMVTVFLGCVFTTQAHASNKLTREPSVDRCEVLVVHIGKPILNEYIMSTHQFLVDHGYFQGCQVINDNMDCQFEQSDFYGPDATLLFKNKAGGQIVTIRVQQNFCFWEAGNITIKPIRGKWVYSSHEGSLRDNQHGDVWLDQVSFNN